MNYKKLIGIIISVILFISFVTETRERQKKYRKLEQIKSLNSSKKEINEKDFLRSEVNRLMQENKRLSEKSSSEI